MSGHVSLALTKIVATVLHHSLTFYTLLLFSNKYSWQPVLKMEKKETSIIIHEIHCTCIRIMHIPFQ